MSVLVVAAIVTLVFVTIVFVAVIRRRRAERRQYEAERDHLTRLGLAWGFTPFDDETNEEFRERMTNEIKNVTRPITDLPTWRRPA